MYRWPGLGRLAASGRPSLAPESFATGKKMLGDPGKETLLEADW